MKPATSKADDSNGRPSSSGKDRAKLDSKSKPSVKREGSRGFFNSFNKANTTKKEASPQTSEQSEPVSKQEDEPMPDAGSAEDEGEEEEEDDEYIQGALDSKVNSREAKEKVEAAKRAKEEREQKMKKMFDDAGEEKVDEEPDNAPGDADEGIHSMPPSCTQGRS